MSRRRLAAVTALLALLAGCSSFPSSGPVLDGPAADAPREGDFEVAPEGPQPGADPQAIVTGFIRASAGFSNDHRVARSFLTPQRQLTWRPDDAVAVYPADSSLRVAMTSGVRSTATSAPAPGAQAAAGGARPDVTPSAAPPAETATVTVRTPVQATLDTDGRYTPEAPGATKTSKFTVARSGGNWRISGVDNGILIKSSDFGVTFRSYAVYFADPTGRYLVPELHWFASSQVFGASPELPTALVRVLLEGPPPWLQGAVTTGLPPQTRMALAAVVVNDDVATVDLTEQVRSATTAQRRMLLAQLEATLGQLSTIAQVKITVQRTALEVPAVSSDSASPLTDPVIDSRAVLIDSRGRVARLDRGSVESVGGLSGLAVRGAAWPAVSRDSSVYAVLNARRDKLMVQMPGATKASTPVRAPGLTAPSFDPEGRVWTAAAAGGPVFMAGAASATVRVSAPWLKRFTVVALRVSRDGTRVALAVRYRGQGHLFVAGVLRDSAGRPVQLTKPLALLPDLTSVSDVTWADEDHLAVLGRRAGYPSAQPWVVQVGGTVSSVTALPGAVALTAGNGETTMLAATSSAVWTRVGARWLKTAPGRQPAYPG